METTRRNWLPGLAVALIGVAALATPTHGQDAAAGNPIIWADVPDPSVVRVGDVYYMSSTTMHVNPGVPIMKSVDLVNWDIVGYAYDVLADNDALALRNGQNAYGRGSWASSIRHRDGIFYVVTFSYSTGRTHIYQTHDVENGPWTEYVLPTVHHDPSLFFDDDGRVYLVYGIDDIRIVELTSDVTAIEPGGLNRVLIPQSSRIAGTDFIVSAEGAHLHKVDDRYYVFLISWPQGGMRTELVYRADSLTGSYEGRIVLQDAGIAQGGLVDTPQGDWYAMLFQDAGAVGRTPWLVPVCWEDGWPVLGEEGRAPRELALPPSSGLVPGIIAPDEFDDYADVNGTGDAEPRLALAWQWNHNPVDSLWSVTERPGYLRLTNGRMDGDFVSTQNTLTQRVFGPQSSAHVAMETSNMRDGDYAGLGALQANYGFVGVRKSGGSTSIVMVDGSQSPAVEAATIPVEQDRVYLRIDMDFRNRTDRARFLYSLDGTSWQAIGNTLRMSYTLPHFMGYRFALFNYATNDTGGYVDFDYFRIGATYEESTRSDAEGLGARGLGGFDVDENYPNPFRATTNISYELAIASTVRLDVFDVRGRRIDTLHEAHKPAGRHTLTFDATGLPSGPYFYRLSAGGRTRARSMVVVR